MLKRQKTTQRNGLEGRALKELFKLFFMFARIGALTFGGGYAMLPMLQREVVEKNAWATEQELMDYYAIGQCTPGIIAVNTATFIGYRRRGVVGGIVATLGVVFPSLVIIILIAAFLNNFAEIPLVQNAFAGLRVCVCVLVFNAVVKLFCGSVADVASGLVFAAVFALSLFTSVSAVLLVVLAGVAGIVIKKVGGRK